MMTTLAVSSLLRCAATGVVLLAAVNVCQASNAAAGKPAAPAANALEVDEPNVEASSTTEYACELGNKITIYTNPGDDSHIALRWKKRLHRLSRVSTTTGAQRYENPHYGLIWIGIPSKGILLDSKQNRQLANECKHAEQALALARATPASGAPEAMSNDALAAPRI